MKRTKLEKVSLGAALFAWASVIGVACGPAVLGHDMHCFPNAQSVLQQWSLLVPPALVVSISAALVSLAPQMSAWRRVMLGPGLCVILVASAVTLEPFTQLIAQAIGDHAGDCDCTPNGLLGYFPRTWQKLYGVPERLTRRTRVWGDEHYGESY